MFKPTLNSQTFTRQNSVVKIWHFFGGPLAAGGPSHGTTGTMVNPALGVGFFLWGCTVFLPDQLMTFLFIVLHDTLLD